MRWRRRGRVREILDDDARDAHDEDRHIANIERSASSRVIVRRCEHATFDDIRAIELRMRCRAE